MKNCRDLEPLMTPYVDGEAAPRECAEIAAHLDACPHCREQVQAQRATREVIAARRDKLRACPSDSLRHRCAAQREAARPTPAPQPPPRRPFMQRPLIQLA